jgi:hypothetical protein
MGWKPETDLLMMYKRMIASMKVSVSKIK